ADKATGELIVTTRADYQVVSNGVIVEQVDLPGGLRRTHWRQDVPISSWLYSLGIARFIVRQGDVVRGGPLSFWAFPQGAGKGWGRGRGTPASRSSSSLSASDRTNMASWRTSKPRAWAAARST